MGGLTIDLVRHFCCIIAIKIYNVVIQNMPIGVYKRSEEYKRQRSRAMKGRKMLLKKYLVKQKSSN